MRKRNRRPTTDDLPPYAYNVSVLCNGNVEVVEVNAYSFAEARTLAMAATTLRANGALIEFLVQNLATGACDFR